MVVFFRSIFKIPLETGDINGDARWIDEPRWTELVSADLKFRLDGASSFGQTLGLIFTVSRQRTSSELTEYEEAEQPCWDEFNTRDVGTYSWNTTGGSPLGTSNWYYPADVGTTAYNTEMSVDITPIIKQAMVVARKYDYTANAWKCTPAILMQAKPDTYYALGTDRYASFFDGETVAPMYVQVRGWD